MSDLLPTNFVGTTMAGVQADNGQFRVYYQGKDYELYEMQLDSPDSTEYSLHKLTTIAPAARTNTPIAACAWKTLGEIRVYYITTTNQVQEIVYNTKGGWFQGATLGTAVENSTCLYGQVLPGVSLRVGFQSSNAPQTITEAYYLGSESDSQWMTRVF